MGAYTGATDKQLGRFELAAGSTLFLYEIGEMPLTLQAKLLRVLDSGEFERLGKPKTLHSDARIIAATNRKLEDEVRKHRFREDLLYRLKVFTITLPSLRQRQADIPLLIKWYMDQLSRKMGKPPTEISNQTMQALQDYHWPGNVRELKHMVESAMITTRGERLKFDLPDKAGADAGELKSFEEMERDYILQVLHAKDWKIQGTNSAASILRMNPSTLRSRMKKHGIDKPSVR
jgi:formate hydrogenlyase transcriptional activator